MSALGQVDPNVIALNKNLRTQQAQAQAAQQAQQQEDAARQAEIDARKAQAEQDKRDAVIREANSRVGSDPLAQQGRATAGLKDLLASGSSIKQLQAAGYDVDYLTFSKNPTTGEIENLQGFKFVPQAADNSPAPTSSPSSTPAESPVFGSLTLSQAKAAFQNPYRPDMSATERGYAQLQAAQQQVGDYYTKPVFGTLTASQAANSLYIQNEKVQEDTMKANLNAAVTKHYQVNLEDRLSGGPYRYEVNLQDSLSGNTGARVIPTAPPRSTTTAPSGDFFSEAGKGLYAFGSNLVAGPASAISDLFGGRKVSRSTVDASSGETISSNKPTLSPEVEGSVYSGLSSGKSSSLRTGFTLFNTQSFKSLENVGKEIGENSGYAGGSLAGTVATFGIGEVSRLVSPIARSGVNTARSALTSKFIDNLERVGVVQRAEAEPYKARAFVNYENARPLREVANDFDVTERLTAKAQPPTFNFDVNLVREQERVSPIASRTIERPATVADIIKPVEAPAKASVKPVELTEGLLTEPVRVQELGIGGSDLTRNRPVFAPEGKGPLLEGLDLAAQNKEISAATSRVIPELSEARTLKTETSPVQRQAERIFNEKGQFIGGGEVTTTRAPPKAVVSDVDFYLGQRSRQQLGAGFVAEGDFLGSIGLKPKMAPKELGINLTARSEEEAFTQRGDFFSIFGEVPKGGKALPKGRIEALRGLGEGETEARGDFLSIFGEGVRPSKQTESSLKDYFKQIDEFNKSPELSISRESSRRSIAARKVLEASGRKPEALTAEDIGVKLTEPRKTPKRVRTGTDIIKQMESKTSSAGEKASSGKSGQVLVQRQRQANKAIEKVLKQESIPTKAKGKKLNTKGIVNDSVSEIVASTPAGYSAPVSRNERSSSSTRKGGLLSGLAQGTEVTSKNQPMISSNDIAKVLTSNSKGSGNANILKDMSLTGVSGMFGQSRGGKTGVIPQTTPFQLDITDTSTRIVPNTPSVPGGSIIQAPSLTPRTPLMPDLGIPTSKPPRNPPLDIPFFGEEKHRKRRKNEGKLRYGERTFRANDILASFSPALAKAFKGIKIE